MRVSEGQIESRSGQTVKYQYHQGESDRETIIAVQSIGGIKCWDAQVSCTEEYDLLRFNAYGNEAESNASDNVVDNMISLCQRLKIANPHILAHSLACVGVIRYCRLTLSKVHTMEQARQRRESISRALGIWKQLAPRSVTLVTPVLGFPKKEELFLPPKVFLFLEPSDYHSYRENFEIYCNTLRGPYTAHVSIEGLARNWTHFPFQKQPREFNQLFMDFLNREEEEKKEEIETQET